MKILQRNFNKSRFVVREMKRNVSVVCFKFHCNTLISGKINKEMPGSVASGTHCITQYWYGCLDYLLATTSNPLSEPRVKKKKDKFFSYSRHHGDLTNRTCRDTLHRLQFKTIFFIFIPPPLPHSTAVGWGTVLQAWRSRVWFPTASLEFFVDIILLATLWPWGRLGL